MLRRHDLTQKTLPTYLHTYSPTYIPTNLPTYLPCNTKQSCRLDYTYRLETLITILTIENLNSWQYLLLDNQEWQWTAFAILAMFYSNTTHNTSSASKVGQSCYRHRTRGCCAPARVFKPGICWSILSFHTFQISIFSRFPYFPHSYIIFHMLWLHLLSDPKGADLTLVQKVQFSSENT